MFEHKQQLKGGWFCMELVPRGGSFLVLASRRLDNGGEPGNFGDKIEFYVLKPDDFFEHLDGIKYALVQQLFKD